MKYIKPQDRVHTPAWHRVDPGDCGCTDCLTGWSIPFNRLAYRDDDLHWIAAGNEFDDASGSTLADWDAALTAIVEETC